MSEKPPLTDEQVHEALHNAWMMLASEVGGSDFGNNTLKAARLSLFNLQMALMMKMEGVTSRTPAEPSSHSD